MHPKYRIVLTVAILLFFVSACNLSPQQVQQPVQPQQQDQASNQDAVGTQVAQTMAAQGSVETNVAQTMAAQGAVDTQVAGTMAAQGAAGTAAAQTQAADSQSQQEPSPTSTPTATEEYEPVIGVRALNLGSPDELYDFDSPNQLMFDYTGTNDRAYFENGKFVFEIDDPIGFDIWTYSWLEDKNYYVELTIQMPTCSGNDRAGFIFRTPQNIYDAGYVFQISCDGYFRLTNWDGAVHNDLISWSKHNIIKTGSGAINRVGVHVNGTFYRLFVNAVEVGSFNELTYQGIGKIGLVIGVDGTSDFKVLFDDFAYWDLP